MKKIFAFSLMIALFLCLLSGAAAAPARMGDNANLFSASDEAVLARRLDDLSAQYGVDVVIATTNDSRGMQIGMYAADLVDYNGFKTDNIIFVIAMDIREYTCVTTGYCITAFTDYMLEEIYDAVESDMREGDYSAAANTYIDLCARALEQAKTGAPYDVGNPLDPSTFIERFSIGLVISFIPAFFIGWLIARAKKNAMKTARPQRSAESYLRDMRLTRERDIYLYTTTTRRKIETNNGGGKGGSSVFSGSSGTSHGGGGGRGF